MLGAMDQAVQGMRAGFDRLDRAADRIARHGAEGDLAGDMVDLMRARQEVKTNAAVIRTADDTIGTLIDLLA
jgi:hypothetical protein